MCFQFGAAVAMKPTRQCALILRRRFLFDHQFPGVSDQHRLPIFENASNNIWAPHMQTEIGVARWLA